MALAMRVSCMAAPVFLATVYGVSQLCVLQAPNDENKLNFRQSKPKDSALTKPGLRTALRCRNAEPVKMLADKAKRIPVFSDKLADKQPLRRTRSALQDISNAGSSTTTARVKKVRTGDTVVCAFFPLLFFHLHSTPLFECFFLLSCYPCCLICSSTDPDSISAVYPPNSHVSWA